MASSLNPDSVAFVPLNTSDTQPAATEDELEWECEICSRLHSTRGEAEACERGCAAAGPKQRVMSIDVECAATGIGAAVRSLLAHYHYRAQ